MADGTNVESALPATRRESLEALASSVRKSEAALAGMRRRGANTTLVRRRLRALTVGLAALERAWQGVPYPYTPADLAEARDILAGLLPSIERICARSGEGSRQRTLLERRIAAMRLAIRALDEASAPKGAR